ncbi:hypothetical protein F4818DRAFT_213225 [Hypoxylon cercidicola]|nr:hypothetical protein F4818DRAFT_213225 [Hypoxylon cercidicola]
MDSNSEAVNGYGGSGIGNGNGNGNVNGNAPAPAPASAPAASALTDPSATKSHHPTITATATATATADQLKTNSSASSKNSIHHTHRQSHSSSKLPAYRFADLKKEPIALPSLLQNQIPPSPVSPEPDHHTETQPNTAQDLSPQTAHKHNNSHNYTTRSSVSSEQSPTDRSSPTRFRASTFQTPTLSTATSTSTSANAKRSASLDSSTSANKRTPSTTDVKSPTDSTDTIVIRPQHRRAPLSAGSLNDNSSRQRMHASDDTQGAPSGEDAGREWTHGQRELLLPKTIQRTVTDEKRSSVVRRPPVSYKPPPISNGSGGSASIPPIRSFRSSGERRRSLVLDMNVRSARTYDGNDDYGDSNHRDRTLRALEGRRSDDASQITPPDSAGDRPDGDDGDLFLKIAREDPLRRGADNNGNYGESQGALSRVTRSNRRPLSMGVSSYQPTSPPQVSRRMSDQETSRPRGFSDDQSGDRAARTLTYRGFNRDRSSDEAKSKGYSTPLRGSPLTPRSLAFQDQPSDQGSGYSRRRQPSIDNGTPVPSRMSSLKQSSVNYSHPRTYSSSPLVPKSMDPQKQDAQLEDAHQGVEGTNSTTSTAAPSTVWDELDDLKSRIHRLELTGKLPPTSGAAISRASEERPPTAHTNATTLSASPKRSSGGAVQASDTNSIQKDGHPLLLSALVKSKGFLSSEVYEALETAASDALGLSLMMGTAGQPGPISSGASSIGSGTTITDRQLRRKADSICRSLTELCLALSEGAAQIKPQQVTAPAQENNPTMSVTSPTITKFPGPPTTRRPSITERTLTLNTSPRALSRYEERRNISSALPTPRYSATTPATPTDALAASAGRKTSLLISRTRRAGTEEPEEGRKSSLLRTRRATTEEPEEQYERKPLLTRGRRGTLDNEDEEVRFRAPSRAITEVHGIRSGTREYASQLPAPPSKEPEPLASSALPRRRLASSALNSRLVLPASTTGIATPARRYFDRSTPDRETYNTADRASEERPQRQFSLARHESMDKRNNRASMIATSSPATGGYR